MMRKDMKKIAVIGGGASGMMAALAASEIDRNSVFLFEKNIRVGKKLYITGKGRCNITNICDITEFMDNINSNSRFLYSAFSTFNNYDTIDFFEKSGVPTKTERGGRVFPISDKASDVVDALYRQLIKKNVKIYFHNNIKGVIIENGVVKGLEIDGIGIFEADAVVIATGGLSYPQTGSTGDGYTFAESAGHTVTKLYPSLVALKTKEKWVAGLAGLSLKNINATFYDDGKKVFSDFGEMLFTHFGVSGPVIISGSSHIASKSSFSNVTVLIDLKPALNEDMLEKRILRDFEKYANKDLKNSLNDLLPKKLIPVIIDLAGIDESKKIWDITKNERKSIVDTIKKFKLTITGTEGFDHAVITGGGVSVKEINPKTMESKKVKKLYFAGEIIDVDAYTGGYNLQIAFSTGFLAGRSAASAFTQKV